MDIQSFIPIATFLSDYLGEDCEVILSDSTKEKVVFVKNAHHNHIKIGSPLSSVEKKFLDNKLYKEKDSIINYRAFSSEHKKLRSATHFIKNDQLELIGMLTINYSVSPLIELRDVLNNLISGSTSNEDSREEFYESFNVSFEDLMNTTIMDAIKKYDIPPERLSHEEKIELIRTLDEKGTFLIKGSIPELAKLLDTSETSIYRYINKL
ncbi:transcriptional regulator [Pseudogracilibacillus auburnensis]|uniref:Putative transcriptional regulator YheO n=1 Tax=Pseudogracilibacillus auburnensis TaxID=1494959 RepID=A0A2V3VWI8_9BACI|nr:PAS domain-containing protein [Pseudogracilibacillus auburnensis]MBO1003337.1 PAS domain-containing protein [Pseudogracilibacillus auburnensis]PXW85364.1 putative transcriptional regulator YheO [Pseudogracilibacillus auburnensis]